MWFDIMNFSQENMVLFNAMILEAIIYGRGCEENSLGYCDDADLCSSVKLFLHSLGIKNIIYKQEGYVGLANSESFIHIES